MSDIIYRYILNDNEKLKEQLINLRVLLLRFRTFSRALLDHTICLNERASMNSIGELLGLLMNCQTEIIKTQTSKNEIAIDKIIKDTDEIISAFEVQIWSSNRKSLDDNEIKDIEEKIVSLIDRLKKDEKLVNENTRFRLLGCIVGGTILLTAISSFTGLVVNKLFIKSSEFISKPLIESRNK